LNSINYTNANRVLIIPPLSLITQTGAASPTGSEEKQIERFTVICRIYEGKTGLFTGESIAYDLFLRQRTSGMSGVSRI